MINSFRKFLENWNNTDYYISLSTDQYNAIDLYHDLVPFSSSEVAMTEKAFKKARLNRDNNVSPNWKGLRFKTGKRSVQVSKLDDEWIYFIYINSKTNSIRCFKCDQFDGFLKCIEDHPASLRS